MTSPRCFFNFLIWPLLVPLFQLSKKPESDQGRDGEMLDISQSSSTQTIPNNYEIEDRKDWINAKPTYKTSKVYTKRYKRSITVQGNIISMVCNYMLDMNIDQLSLVVDLMWHRLCSEKVAGEFFPHREAMWFALKECKYVLKHVGKYRDASEHC